MISDSGMYDGYFIGMTPEFEWVSPFNDPCRLCKGSKLDRKGETCFVCHGSGKRTEMHVKLRYELDNGNIEEEEMNFKLAAPDVGRDGQPLSPSTLFIRLRTFMGNRQATAEDLDAWYSSLPEPIRIPIQVVITDNKSGTALKITTVMRRGANGNGGAQAAQRPQGQRPPQGGGNAQRTPQQQAPAASEYYDDDFAGSPPDDEIPY